MAESNVRRGPRKKLILILALAAVTVVIIALFANGSPGLPDDGRSDGNDSPDLTDNTTRFISENNSVMVIGLDDLPAGWEINISYEFLGSYTELSFLEGSLSRYSITGLGNDSVQYLEVELFRLNSVERADQIFDENYSQDGADHWQGVDLEVIGPVEVGDEAVLCSSNGTGTSWSIKTIAFRQNNVLCFIIHHSVPQLGLTNEATIDIARLQDAKLIG